MRAFPDHVTERLRRLGVDPALLEPEKVDVQEWGSRELGRRWRVIRLQDGRGAIIPSGDDTTPRRWCVGRLADGRGVIALSVGADPKGIDDDTYVIVLPPGGRPTPEDTAAFKHLHPDVEKELQYAVADLSRMVQVRIPDIAAAAAPSTSPGEEVRV
jgi:hypothetical protein